MSQSDTVLWMLRRGWTCGSEFRDDAHIPRYSARLTELRASGWGLDRRKCTRHRHKTVQYEWRVVSHVDGVGQGVWDVA